MEMKKIGIICCVSAVSMIASAQSAFDAYSVSQTDLKGTARFMSMAGAFGALGGDLSVLNQNPGGIGVYRSSDLGLTFDWNVQRTSTGEGADLYKTKNTNFNFNNIGYVGTIRTGSADVPNVNWGFTYNKSASFKRHYVGTMSSIQNSLTNFVAGQTNAGLWTTDDLGAVQGGMDNNGNYANGYNPYQESNAPWMSILAYNSYLINPNSSGDSFDGLFRDGTTGRGEFEVEESGQVNEFNLSLGGNFRDMLYWGASLGIIDLKYDLYSYYGESLYNANVPYIDAGNNERVGTGSADWGMENYLRMRGTGINFKLGFILKPVNEFRIGLAFHTPTFYSMRSEYNANTSYYYTANGVGQGAQQIDGTAETDEGYVGTTEFNMQTPWKFMASVAGVIGGRGILSFDYERDFYPSMRVSYGGREDMAVTGDIKQYYKASDILRVGGEFKVTPQFSVRAGYSYQSSPYTTEIRNDKLNVVTAGTTLAYTLDNDIQYITAGVGYRYKAFYIDMAYVHKNRSSEYYAFSPDVNNGVTVQSNKSKLTDSNNEIALTLGFKF